MRRYLPDPERFASAASNADVVPVYRQLLGDHLTPVTAFEVLGRVPHAFLLESVVGGEQVARHSFIATSPSLVYTAFMGKATITQRSRKPREFDTADPLADLEQLLPKRAFHRDKNLPAFTGGLV